jgi:C4-dicarboxylate-specific signal transduction histidine kinase
VAVDPGELDAIILNLMTNAIYWLGDVPKENRVLEFRLTPISDGQRVRVWVHDTGPGLNTEDVERVFWPGVTRKPDGIGMGLTVASELVAAYGGRMSTKHPGTKGGASFAFDLPLRKQT